MNRSLLPTPYSPLAAFDMRPMLEASPCFQPSAGVGPRCDLGSETKSSRKPLAIHCSPLRSDLSVELSAFAAAARLLCVHGPLSATRTRQRTSAPRPDPPRAQVASGPGRVRRPTRRRREARRCPADPRGARFSAAPKRLFSAGTKRRGLTVRRVPSSLRSSPARANTW